MVARILIAQGSEATLKVLGTFATIAEAEKELRTGAILGKDVYILSVRRHFTNIETTAVPRTHLYENERPYTRGGAGKRKARKESNTGQPE